MDPKEIVLNFPQIMELSFKAGHSLIVGHKPKEVKLTRLGDACSESKNPVGMENFGLFDSSAPNYTTFYPEAKAEDWTPKDEEFIYPVFRLFSETIVVKHGVPIDFSQGTLVKDSMALLVGLTVNPDHEKDVVGNALGAVLDVAWQNSYKTEGVKVPAGINGVLKIDAKSNPRLARGITMSPPSIHSDSVTVKFKWKKSHESDEEFWSKTGTYDKDGNLYRLIVTEIVLYHELSLVSHGADPYAQILDENGIINNPKYASTVYGLSADKNKTRFDFKNMGVTTHSFNFNDKPLKTPDMTFTELLLALGLDEKNFKDQDELMTALKASLVSQTQLQALLTVDEKLTPDTLTALIARPEKADEGLTADQTIILDKVTDLGGLDQIDLGIADGVAYLTAIRAGALANYKLVMGDKSDETIEKTIKEANLTQAKAFETQYSAMVEEKLPMTCKSCNSTEVDRASSTTEDPEEKQTYKQMRDELAVKSKKKPSDFHKED